MNFCTALFTFRSYRYLNPLPDEKFLDSSKLKDFADDKF